MSEEFTYEVADVTKTDTVSVLLELYHELVHHLQCSPAFYPGKEFTDELYQEYIQMPETKVFIARKDGNIVGMIDASPDMNHFLGGEGTIYTGDIYFIETERGKGGAKSLLQYAADYYVKRGVNRFIVEHGTTNPNAVQFWDRYYTRYSYTLNRKL